MSKKVWYKIAEFITHSGYSKRRIREFIKQGHIRKGNWKRAGNRRAYHIRVPEAMEDIRNSVAGRNPETRNPALQNPPPPTPPAEPPARWLSGGTVAIDDMDVMAAAQALAVAPATPLRPPMGGDAVTAAGFHTMTLTEAQAEQARQKATDLKMKNDERAGRLVDAAQVAEDAFNCARLTRDAVLGVPDRIAAELASITDPHKLNDKLTTELVQALEELGARL